MPGKWVGVVNVEKAGVLTEVVTALGGNFDTSKPFA